MDKVQTYCLELYLFRVSCNFFIEEQFKKYLFQGKTMS